MITKLMLPNIEIKLLSDNHQKTSIFNGTKCAEIIKVQSKLSLVSVIWNQ